MNTVYKRNECGSITHVSIREGLAEVNHAMMLGSEDVWQMSSSKGSHIIDYRDGRKVTLLEVDDAPVEAAPVARTARIGLRAGGGEITGRVVTVKDKDYVLAELTPADRPRHVGAPKDWKPTAYVTYWSARNGERFGPTRTAGPTAKPGSVGHALFHNAMDHANGTGA